MMMSWWWWWRRQGFNLKASANMLHWRLCITSDHWTSHAMRLSSVFGSTMFGMPLILHWHLILSVSHSRVSCYFIIFISTRIVLRFYVCFYVCIFCFPFYVSALLLTFGVQANFADINFSGSRVCGYKIACQITGACSLGHISPGQFPLWTFPPPISVTIVYSPNSDLWAYGMNVRLLLKSDSGIHINTLHLTVLCDYRMPVNCTESIHRMTDS